MNNTYFKIFIFFACGILIASCKKSSEHVSLELEPSIWVESSDRTDTLVFLKENMLTLNRPKEVRSGYLLPRLGAGLYLFKEKRDSINMQNLVSSSLSTKYHYFKVEKTKLYIGDFYQKGSGQVLVFEKLR